MSGFEIIPMLTAAGSVLGGVGAIMGSKSRSEAPAAPPPLPTPVEMPSADDTRVAQARRRSVAAQRQRQGRESTILVDAVDDKLGG